MYTPYRDEVGLKINMPWETNTAKGFGYSIIICLFLVLIASLIKIEPATRQTVEVSRIPIEILNFGDGDGTGISKGNLTAEGMKHLGSIPITNLNDAVTAAKTQLDNKVSQINPEDATNFSPTKDVASSEKINGVASGTGARNVGSPIGSLDGRGIGDKGYGHGKGLGLGDIEWGGGGNRTVLDKRIPSFPPGAKGGQVRIKFVVDQEGMVVSMRPAQKGGDPILERAAMNALRMWRFNPLRDKKDMEGIISFTFKLS